MMDKRFLDPRRPLGTPTKEDQAEMLVPYDVELPLNPQFFATNQHQVADLAGGPHVLACRVYDTPQQISMPAQGAEIKSDGSWLSGVESRLLASLCSVEYQALMQL